MRTTLCVAVLLALCGCACASPGPMWRLNWVSRSGQKWSSSPMTKEEAVSTAKAVNSDVGYQIAGIYVWPEPIR